MKTSRWSLVCLTAITFILPACHAEISYELHKEITIGGDGGWDYLSIDQDARRLYVSHATKIIVIDLDSEKIVGEIADTPGVHGLAIAPKLQRGFSSNGGENKASIIDLKTLKTLAKVATGENPDAILFAPSANEVYTFNGHDDSATVFDAQSGKVVATIPLSGKPEFAVTDDAANRIYLNIEDKDEVAVIDTKSHKVVTSWSIAPDKEATGMAIDLAHHRLFVGCHSQHLLMMDSTTGKIITSVPIDEGVDANEFDPGTQLAFSSNGAGTVTIAHEDSPDKLSVVQTLKTERGARTMALDLKTHNIYLATAKFEPQGTGRPKLIAGMFKVLVYELKK